eukprot:Gb_23686 [translate_table: standard]
MVCWDPLFFHCYLYWSYFQRRFALWEARSFHLDSFYSHTSCQFYNING